MSETLSQSTAAELLGVTARRLRQLAKSDDPPPQDATGRYPVAAFGAWLRARKSGGNDGGSADGSAYERRAHWQAALAQLKYQEAKREVIPLEECRREYFVFTTTTIRFFQTLPDVLERDMCIGPDVVAYIIKLADRMRDDLAEKVDAAFKPLDNQ